MRSFNDIVTFSGPFWTALLAEQGLGVGKMGQMQHAGGDRGDSESLSVDCTHF
jgi:hypothetical protein